MHLLSGKQPERAIQHTPSPHRAQHNTERNRKHTPSLRRAQHNTERNRKNISMNYFRKK